jgi:anaerobic selenocysteine-containing dehydrogenase
MGEKGNTGIEAKKGKTIIKGLSLTGGEAGYPCAVDVEEGKITRVRPLRYDWKYDKKTFNPCKIEAHGQTFKPYMKALFSPLGLAYKKRIYSPKRILYPLKRVDWEPNGKRNPENRGQIELEVRRILF